MKQHVQMLAFDFGASSGRAILGKFDGEKIDMEEIHRFSNDPVSIRGSLHWDVLRLFHEIKQGLLKTKGNAGGDILSMGIDTWGVDFGLLDEKGALLGNPYHYRDTRTENIADLVLQKVSKEELFEETGIQLMWFNTLYQLYVMKMQKSPLLDHAKTLLLMPDLFNYFLTGIQSTEFTNASTTQMLDPRTGTWAKGLLDKLEIPTSILTDIVDAGTVLGPISEDICQELGIPSMPVISVASHDTGSAVAAVPVIDEKDYVYISCGTWSLLGVELAQPLITQASQQMNFTNEGGVNRSIRFLKNIMGLWLVQECRRQWIREGTSIGFGELGEMAAAAAPFQAFIDPDHHSFITPGDMPNRVRDFCRQTGQKTPETKGEVIRCVLESLAFQYRYAVEALERLLDKKLNVIHMVGGGIQDKLLCQFTANATGRVVIAGPVEATAMGNIIVQGIALKEIANLQEGRQIVKNSFETEVYEPKDTEAWEEAYHTFLKATQ